MEQQVLDKFNNYVRRSVDILTNKRIEIVSNIECAKQLDVVSNESSIGDLLALKEYILKNNPKLASDIKLLEFFSAKNSLNVPQVKAAYNNVLSVVLNGKEKNIKELNNQIKSIDKAILEYNNYLNGKRYNVKIIFELIESSELTSEEQVEVLSDIALKISPSKELEVVEEKKAEELKEDKQEDTDYYELLINGKNILIKYYDTLASKTPQEMKDIINVSQIISSMNIDDVKIFYKENIVFAGLVYRIKTLVNELAEALKNNNPNKDDLYLELALVIETLGGLKPDHETTSKEENINVYFLLDNVGNPLFNINYDIGELGKIDALVTRLINVPGEIANGRLVQNAWLETNKIKAYVKSFSDMCCSYLKMSDNKILIIDIAPLNHIYDETANLIKKNQVRIEEIMDIVKENNEEFNIVQKNFINSLHESLTSRGR